MKDEAAPIPVQFTITLTALVYPEPEPEVIGRGAGDAGLLYPGRNPGGDPANLREAAEGWLVSAHNEAMDRDSAEEGTA